MEKEDLTPPKKAKKNKKEKVVSNSLIEKNKSAQIMFKTALRNHIDLTNIADNKANMMLSINAIIITIAMPLLATNLQDTPSLLIPTAILLTTSVLSIVSATLVTRPIKMSGKTDLTNLKTKGGNLFFFGNFYKMGLPEYKKGMRLIVEDEKTLDDTIMTDLYFLGKALGNKYSMLRICYSIFMIGITVAVIAFAFTFHWHPKI